MIEKNLELNITDDNNFFVSNTFVEKIKYLLKAEPQQVTNDEIDLLKRVEERKDICIEQNIHYFVLPDPTTSLGAYCHWCSVNIAEYSKKLRTQKNE